VYGLRRGRQKFPVDAAAARTLDLAIDGIRAGLLQKPSGRGSGTLTMPVRRPSSR
jgi:hypothetical protein